MSLVRRFCSGGDKEQVIVIELDHLTKWLGMERQTLKKEVKLKTLLPKPEHARKLHEDSKSGLNS